MQPWHLPHNEGSRDLEAARTGRDSCYFPELFRVSFFVTLEELPSGPEGEGEVWGGRELAVPRTGSANFKHE